MKRIMRAPSAVRAEVTARCNLACRHCVTDSSPHTKGPVELMTGEWIRLFERLSDLQVFRLTISGGELFVREDAETLLEVACSLGFAVSVLTNGTLIDDRLADRLARMRISHIAIPLDGLKENHDHIRGLGSFDLAVRGIKALLRVAMKPIICYVPMRHNVGDAGALIDFLAREGVRAVEINDLRPEGRCQQAFSRLSPRYPDDIKCIVETVEAMRLAHPDVRIACSAAYFLQLAKSYEIHGGPRLETGEPRALMAGCGACRTSCVITPQGDVVPCHGFEAFAGGNVVREDFLQIWRTSTRFAEIRELGEHRVTAVPECAECPYRYWCHGGCRASAYSASGDLMGPDPTCPHWRNRASSP